MSYRLTVGIFDWLAGMLLSNELPEHLRTGRFGEEKGYLELRKPGYIMVARNFRSPPCRGEIDLIGGMAMGCVLEVKPRTAQDVKPAQASRGSA